MGDRERRPVRAESGFTLIELLVTLGLLVVLIIALLTMFDFSSRTARTQMHVTEMQQSQRVAQQTVVKAVRMAGRGGLPTWDGAMTLPAGKAIAIADNVAADTLVAGDADAPVLEGTDVVTVRGIFDSPVYQHDPIAGDFIYDTADGTGSLVLRTLTSTGVRQPLGAMKDALDRANAGGPGDEPEALFVMSPLGEYAVFEITGGSSDTSSGEINSVSIVFSSAGALGTEYTALSQGGVVSPTLTTVAYAGILEEYRYYVRALRAVPGDDTSELMPQLARARVYPNTDVPWGREASRLTEVVADNVLDLQVAIGVDTDGDEAILESSPGGVTFAADEWLFNHGTDDPTEARWNTAGNPLFYVRISTIVQTDRPEPYYAGGELTSVENKDYTVSPFDAYNTGTQLRYHRRQLQTIVDLRNL